MTVHNRLRPDTAPPPLIETIAEIPGLLPSAILTSRGLPIAGATGGDLRDFLLGIGADLRVEHDYGEDDPLGQRLALALTDGATAIAAGHLYELDPGTDISTLTDRQPDPAILPELRVPYPVTPVMIMFGGEPWLFVLHGDQHGQLVQAVIVTLRRHETSHARYIAPLALISVHRTPEGEPRPLIHVDTPHQELPQVDGYLWMAWTLLPLIKNNRVSRRRASTSATTNTTRLMRGMPGIPDSWHIDPHTAAENDTTAHKTAQRSSPWAAHPQPVADEPALPRTAFFAPYGAMNRGNSNADIRAHLLAIGPPPQPAPGDDDIQRVMHTLYAAGMAQTQGHGFDIGAGLELGYLLQQSPPREALDCLGVPYAIMPVSVMLDGAPMLFIQSGDTTTGRLRQATIAYLCDSAFSREPMLTPLASIGFNSQGGDHHTPFVPSHMSHDETAVITRLAGAAQTILMMINDDRLPARRNLASAKLNKARARRGKPPLPAHWVIDGRRARELYTTTLGPHRRDHGAARGGHHASPTPHDRRGHQRRLHAGRTVWIRPSRVGELVRHLTRKRAFYQLGDRP